MLSDMTRYDETKHPAHHPNLPRPFLIPFILRTMAEKAEIILKTVQDGFYSSLAKLSLNSVFSHIFISLQYKKASSPCLCVSFDCSRLFPLCLSFRSGRSPPRSVSPGHRPSDRAREAGRRTGQDPCLCYALALWRVDRPDLPRGGD